MAVEAIMKIIIITSPLNELIPPPTYFPPDTPEQEISFVFLISPIKTLFH
jgi:hypothetical protein